MIFISVSAIVGLAAIVAVVAFICGAALGVVATYRLLVKTLISAAESKLTPSERELFGTLFLKLRGA